ncbi:MAG: F0F1 ATP synthase subunit alpha, partial [Gammaproteobacteria bacterium]
AQYRELAAFAQFASDLDEATRKQLERGQRVMELMKQRQYSPLPIADMAISLFAVDRGYLDDVELERIQDFESALHGYMHSEYGELMDRVNDSGDYDDEIEAAFTKALEDFKATQSW